LEILDEHSRKPKVSVSRLAAHGAIAAAMIVVSLAIGVVAYHVTADLSWIDALLNASMILTGMGPVDPLPNTAAKAPLVHRFLHRFHLELDDALGDEPD